MSDPISISIDSIFKATNGAYVVPVYQRNYAWGLAEIEALINDISYHEGGGYYIGTLIVQKRENGEFEVIDGQQRLTTLSIICACLKNSKNYENILRFEAREQSSYLLENFFSLKSDVVFGDLDSNAKKILENYNIIKKLLKNEAISDKLNPEKLKNIKIFRIGVPERTNLNHYFEVMNNRGEQLDIHEVLKARLMAKLYRGKDRDSFATIWEACADMSRPIQMCFDHRGTYTKLKDKDNEEKVISSRDFIFNRDNGRTSIGWMDIYGESGSAISRSAIKEQNEPKRQPIIDFSNFVNQVIVLFIAQPNVNQNLWPNVKKSLNDRDLIKNYGDVKNCEDDIKKFSLFLLKSRFLLDSFIIHRDEQKDSNDFSIKRYNINDSSSHLKNTFSGEKNKNIVMLQSMFHVSYPSNTYKYWLYFVMDWLHKNYDHDEACDNYYGINPIEFIDEMHKIGSVFFGSICSDGHLTFGDDLSCEKSLSIGQNDREKWTWIRWGTGIPNFVFNWLDYLIWIKLNLQEQENVNSDSWYKEKMGIIPFRDLKEKSEIDNRIKSFRFTQRSSVEHFFPQSKAPEAIGWAEGDNVHRFGNLCLISQSENSRFSNLHPKSKVNEFLGPSKNTKKAESLKLVLMMLPLLHKEQWTIDDMESHEEIMLNLLDEGLRN